MLMKESESSLQVLQSGLSRRSYLALLYAIFVFTPAMMYLSLMAGVGGFAVNWFTLVLIVELMRMAGKYLTKQEAFIIYVLSGAEVIPLSVVFAEYYRNSPIVELFNLPNGEPLKATIPDWWAPPPGTGVWEARTLLHPLWTLPIAIRVLSIFAGALGTVALAIMSREIYVEVEDLPFPMQHVQEQTIVTLTERKPERMRTLFACTAFGLFYGLILYAVPILTRVSLGREVQLLPIPWADFTFFIERFLPGASIGVATDLSNISVAFILPPVVLLSMVIGSFARFFVGNWLTVAYGLSPIPWWTPGMNIAYILQRSQLYFWVCPIIGISIAAGIMPLIRNPKKFIRALHYVVKPATIPREERKCLDTFSPIKAIFVPYAAFVLIGVSFFLFLAPEFLTGLGILVIPLMIVLPITLTLVGGRMVGVTGSTISMPGLSYLFYYSTGYTGADVWFVPNLMTTQGTGMLTRLKLAQMVKCTAKSYIYCYFLILPISLLVGFIYVQIFWSMAPIPSASYPGAAIYWPVDAINLSIWITRPPGLFKPLWILGAFIITAVLDIVTHFAHLPLSVIGVAAGFTIVTPVAVTYIIGYVIALLVQKIFGKAWYKENRFLIAGGLVMGQGVSAIIGVALSLLITSVWIKPF